MRVTRVPSMPKDAHQFFDLVRQSALRAGYMDELVARESERVNAIKAAHGLLGELEGPAFYVVNHMNTRIEHYVAEYKEASLVCELAEKIISRVPDPLAEQVLRARYLRGLEMPQILREAGISRGTAYNAERRGMEWIDASGLLTRTGGHPSKSAEPAV